MASPLQARVMKASACKMPTGSIAAARCRRFLYNLEQKLITMLQPGLPGIEVERPS